MRYHSHKLCRPERLVGSRHGHRIRAESGRRSYPASLSVATGQNRGFSELSGTDASTLMTSPYGKPSGHIGPRHPVAHRHGFPAVEQLDVGQPRMRDPVLALPAAARPRSWPGRPGEPAPTAQPRPVPVWLPAHQPLVAVYAAIGASRAISADDRTRLTTYSRQLRRLQPARLRAGRQE
jgi:hypothetical protein